MRSSCTVPLALYHNKKHQGTTTQRSREGVLHELYHNKKHQGTTTVTVCMECDRDYTTTRNIRELQQIVRVFVSWQYYTTTRNIRELQRGCPRLLMLTDYTTTRNIRELQPEMFCYPSVHHYTTTRNIRELQRLTSVCPP